LPFFQDQTTIARSRFPHAAKEAAMADEKETPDSLAKTTDDDVSLKESDLDDVSGGALNAYIKLDSQKQSS
jgi:hypothetical protein